ncbi:MAG: recombinase family protein [Patescibacteria group bacterium]
MTNEMHEFRRAYFAQTGRMAREAMETKARSGIYPLRLPIGYKRVFVEGEERVELDPQTALIIKLAFELIIRKRSSLSKVLVAVRAKGLKGHSGQPISLSALHRLLTNSFYFGDYTYHARVVKGNHRPLVSRDVWNLVSSALRGRIRR